MKYLFFLLLSATTLVASATCPNTPLPSKGNIELKSPKNGVKAFGLKLHLPRKRYQELDKLAIIAICLDGVPIVVTLFTYLIWGGFAAGFALAFSSIFALAGMVLGTIALVRAAFRGWRRGTFWAVLALGIPLLFLLLTVLIH